MDTNSVPVTWSELLAADHELLTEGLDAIRDVPDEIERVTPPWLPSNELGAPSLTVAQTAVVLGPRACRVAIETLMPLIPRVMTDFRDGITNANRVPAQQLLSLFNTAQCCDVAVSSDVTAAEGAWPVGIATHLKFMSDNERTTLAFSALAVGRADLVPSVIAGGDISAAVTPGETFGFNVQGFIRYLAAARQHGASYEAVEPAWLDFVARFPYKLAAGTLDWPDLLYAGRIVLTEIRGDNIGTVANSVRMLAENL
jgi:hypothetical protein